MLINLQGMLVSSGFEEFFATNRDTEGWETVAQNWIAVMVVIAVACWGTMLVIKWLRKRAARVISEQAWSRGQSIVFIVVGLAPVLLLALAVYFTQRDYFEDIIGIPGLAKGLLFGWALYVVLMLAAHAAGPWKRDLY
jgi:hypothetical protein